MSDRKLIINFIRHGMTPANEAERYLGQVDEHITEKGRADLEALKAEHTYPKVEKVFRSPAIRTKETAEILYPGVPVEVIEGLWEVGFGEKEGIYVSEISGTPKMRRWARMEFDFIMDDKYGESILEAAFRVMGAVTDVIKRCRYEGLHEVAVILHGAIMRILMREALAPQEAADAFKLNPNGMGISVEVDMDEWFRTRKFLFIGDVPEGVVKPTESPFYEEG